MKIIDTVENTKRNLADRLSQASEHYSIKTKKWTFLITGLCCAAVCLSLVLFPCIKQQKEKHYRKIITPALVTPDSNAPLLSQQDENMLQGFLNTMDSIKRVDKSTYEKAMKGREGMIDSILFLLRYTGNSLIKNEHILITKP